MHILALLSRLVYVTYTVQSKRFVFVVKRYAGQGNTDACDDHDFEILS